MGGCVWNRYDDVQRTGSAGAPRYRLHVTEGESTHPAAYPNAPDRVAIDWDADGLPAEVRCSREAPYAMVKAHGEALRLSPRGVSGAVQGLANLYFATCHGEYGNDAELAAEYGYHLR